MEPKDSDQDLLRLLPPIRRSRGWRLYAEDGRRFLDLWSDGGRSILGAKGTGLGTAVKAAVDRGLSRPAPSVWERRLEKALLAAYPGYERALFFRSEEGALSALARAFGRRPDELGILDPALRESPCGSADCAEPDALRLRPFGEHLAEEFLADFGTAAAPPFGLPLLPCPAAFAPGVVLLARGAHLGAGAVLGLAGETVPAVKLAAACRSLAELEGMKREYAEPLWRRSDRRLADFFERAGPYLYPRHPRDEHPAFFRRALAAGLVVSPSHELPSMLPADFDDGELARLSRQP